MRVDIVATSLHERRQLDGEHVIAIAAYQSSRCGDSDDCCWAKARAGERSRQLPVVRSANQPWRRQRCRSLIAMLERRSQAGQMSGTWRARQREKTVRCGSLVLSAESGPASRDRRAIGEERGSRRRP